MRLFVAIPLAEDLKDRLAQAQTELSRRFPAIRPTPREQLHVTLNFLGEAPDDLLPLIEEILREAAAGSASLPFELGALGYFPPRGAPRVIWVSLDDKGGIASIQGKLAQNLRSLDFEPEDRGFFPHATIARSKGEIDPRKLEASLKEIRLPAARQESSEIALYSSVLEKSGAVHSKVCGFIAGQSK